jgi:hypothetical protein
VRKVPLARGRYFGRRSNHATTPWFFCRDRKLRGASGGYRFSNALSANKSLYFAIRGGAILLFRCPQRAWTAPGSRRYWRYRPSFGSMGIGGRFRCAASGRDLARSQRVKLLFDTHAFIWWEGEQSKLSGAALDACQSPANSLHLSLASVWELQIKDAARQACFPASACRRKGAMLHG